MSLLDKITKVPSKVNIKEKVIFIIHFLSRVGGDNLKGDGDSDICQGLESNLKRWRVFDMCQGLEGVI